MGGWRDYDGEGPDPDYGVFGDAGMDRPIPPPPDPKEIERRKRQIEKAERETRVSSDFNRHMIDLYNQSARKA